MNQFWVDKYVKGTLGDLGKEMANFNLFFKFSRAPLPPARKFEEQIEIDHFGEGPGAYIP